jgi:nucleotide-binding universal stress UspA family protein
MIGMNARRRATASIASFRFLTLSGDPMARKRAVHPPIRTVLCPVDFSKFARRALRYAASIVEWSGAQLKVLFVSDPLLLAASETVYHNQAEFLTRTRKELRRFVDNALTGHGLDLGAVECVATGGEPPRDIIQLAASQRADLIVMGTQGLGGFRKLFFGSTTEQVLAQATAPVLVVPPSAKRPRGAITLAWPTDHVVAPLDLSRESERDAARAARVAEYCGADLTLLHVIVPTRAPRWTPIRPAKHDRSRVQAARARLKAISDKVKRSGRVRLRVIEGHAAEQIAALAAKRGTGLLILTGRKGPGLLGHRPGAIAYQAVCRARSPVLVLPGGAGS